MIGRDIINIPMDQLPHSSGSSATGNGIISMPRHTTTTITLPNSLATSATGTVPSTCSSVTTNAASDPKPRLPLPSRPSFGRRQRFTSTYSQLATGIARVQAQPHKPKRPSPLHKHTSVTPDSLDAAADAESPPSDTSSTSSSSSDICMIENKALSPIDEDSEKTAKASTNMLGLDLDSERSWWNWQWESEMQERMLEPKTPFPSPAIYA